MRVTFQAAMSQSGPGKISHRGLNFTNKEPDCESKPSNQQLQSDKSK